MSALASAHAVNRPVRPQLVLSRTSTRRVVSKNHPRTRVRVNASSSDAAEDLPPATWAKEHKVGRCKLDPGLKAHLVSTLERKTRQDCF